MGKARTVDKKLFDSLPCLSGKGEEEEEERRGGNTRLPPQVIDSPTDAQFTESHENSFFFFELKRKRDGYIGVNTLQKIKEALQSHQILIKLSLI